MREDGFSLVELMVVVAIMGILLAIGTLSWVPMQKKGFIEKEIKILYTDLNDLRLDALYTKRTRSAVLSGTTFRVYSSNATGVNPVSTKELRYPVRWNTTDTSLTLTFDGAGLYTASADTPVCVDPDNNISAQNDVYVDSIVISAARIKLGKKGVGACAATNIAQR